MKAIISALIILAVSNISIGLAQPGSLDNSFGTGGKVTVSFAPPEAVVSIKFNHFRRIYYLKVEADKKITMLPFIKE